MIAVIKGDIVASRDLIDQEKWLSPLKQLLTSWGKTPGTWEVVWGDFFQLEIPNPEEALLSALKIKALIKRIEPIDQRRKISTIDVRMAIGIGEKTYTGSKISESNGPAFVFAGNQFDSLKKNHINLAIQSPWHAFDEEINLYLKLAGNLMDKWSVSSAELVEIVLNSPDITQMEIGKQLGIKQNSVSGRWSRSYAQDLLAVEQMFRKKLMLLTR
ncbi:MAG: hypothetical protein JJU34_19955 [Lunatimonas sp.]|uniref:SatD family protein n=1 Tax=Lunatimonas sp. TaxID=2060141 RepID=UPI00263A3F05|nr:SatD family protein [Lunatimonas sp.]MCC5939564.1 hypothetical protein [Lunatimonas sp.]